MAEGDCLEFEPDETNEQFAKWLEANGVVLVRCEELADGAIIMRLIRADGSEIKQRRLGYRKWQFAEPTYGPEDKLTPYRNADGSA